MNKDRSTSERVEASLKTSRPAKVVENYYRLVDAHKIEQLIELFAPEAVYFRPGYEPLRGRTALTDFYNFDRIIVEGRHTITDLVVDGVKVAVAGKFAGRVRSGSEVEFGFADFFVLNDASQFATRETFFSTPLA